jgi:hypothetical protein
MMMFRVSNVEAFRQYQQDDEAELADLLANIRGEREPSPQMLAGTAFHKALELAPTGIEVTELSANGYRFTIADDMELELPTIRELRASKTWIVDGEEVAVSGQVDAIQGRLIHDHKTTGRFDPERYLSGCQWMMYLAIFGAEAFRWNVFEIAECETTNDGPAHWEVFAQHRLEQYRYPGMETDCQRLVEGLARFARVHLPERRKT